MQHQIEMSNELISTYREETITVEHKNGSELVIVKTPANIVRYMDMGYYEVS